MVGALLTQGTLRWLPVKTFFIQTLGCKVNQYEGEPVSYTHLTLPTN